MTMMKNEINQTGHQKEACMNYIKNTIKNSIVLERC